MKLEGCSLLLEEGENDAEITLPLRSSRKGSHPNIEWDRAGLKEVSVGMPPMHLNICFRLWTRASSAQKCDGHTDKVHTKLERQQNP